MCLCVRATANLATVSEKSVCVCVCAFTLVHIDTLVDSGSACVYIGSCFYVCVSLSARLIFPVEN